MSLLETLVALAVMAIVALMLSYGMTGMLGFMRRGEDQSEAIAEVAARQQLRDIIEHAANAPFPGFDFVGIRGDEVEMTVESWLADPPFWPGAPVLLTLSAGSDGAIAAKIIGYDAPGTKFEMNQRLSPTGGLKLAYYGKLAVESDAAWHSTWRSEDGLPMLIAITSATPNSAFPPMMIRPGRSIAQSSMSLSSLVPPALPSRP